MPLYGSHIRNRNANGYIKIGMPVGPSVYDPDEQDEMRSNLAFVADFDHFDEDAYFGLNTYEGNQNAAALNLMYNHYFTYRSSLIVGVQAHLDYYRERLVNPTPWIPGTAAGDFDFDRDEQEAGPMPNTPMPSRTNSRSWRASAAITTPITTAFRNAPRVI